MKTKRQTKKIRREKNRAYITSQRSTFREHGGRTTLFYYYPGELELARARLEGVTTDNFSLAKKLSQLVKRKKRPPGPMKPPSNQGELGFNFDDNVT
jgi:hypothetical protein